MAAIDLGAGHRYAVEGRVVTMNANFDVLDHGAIYIEGDTITDVRDAGAPPPEGFADAPVIRTGDTLYPGLIELHNHLSYNILPLWAVPDRFEHHSQWKRHPEYKSIVSANMAVLGRTPGIVEAIVRYVECKCLLGGVTTSQGVTLNSNSGIKRYYRGLVRNVEQSGHERLPSAGARISDVAAGDAEAFAATLARRHPASYLLHLSEGINDKARGHFLALQAADGNWAITPELCGIHCLGLTAEDFSTFAQRGGSMVWSPLSNLLLYGKTADIVSAKQSGLAIGLGSDWSPSGSKSLLGELKVARLVGQVEGNVFSDRELVGMVTRVPAEMLGWSGALGSLEPGKLADLIAINGRGSDPYQQLIEAQETGLTLVVLGGVPRVGQKQFMGQFVADFEPWRVGRSERLLRLEDPDGDPIVAGLTLAAASQRLAGAMGTLTELALELEAGSSYADGSLTVHDAEFTLELDFEDGEDRTDLFDPVAASQPLSERVVPLELDPLTVADDKRFLGRIVGQGNLPDYVKRGLPALFGREVPAPDQSATPSEPTASDLLASRVTLNEFRELPDLLDAEDRRRILREALTILEENYVHLPFKRAMHAVDPVQRLRLMTHRLEQGASDRAGAAWDSDLDFHDELTRVFNSLHDLHTNYVPAFPYRQKVAFLPFVVEVCHDGGGRRRYVVTKLLPAADFPAEFKPGIELVYYNGTPLARTVQLNAERLGGSNPAAAHARGLFALTIRPLVRSPVPDEDWATLVYRDEAGETHEARFDWQVLTLPATAAATDIQASLRQTRVGLDLQTDRITAFRKLVFAGDTESQSGAPPFTTRTVTTGHGEFGVLRIYTFNVPSADRFVEQVAAALESLPEQGLIIDLRGNGGGSIHAAERLLQLFTPQRVEPLGAQFISTIANLRLCEKHAPSQIDPDLDLGPWVDSLRDAVATGATYSLSHPITSPQSCNLLGQRYSGPVVVVTDALCYSATDIFVAGFVDHGIGRVLGVDANTGAGGANVWSHRQLRLLQHPTLTSESTPDDAYQPLPHGTAFTVAIRRLLRVGVVAGTPLEDLGVRPHERHAMTRDDVLNGNVDLVEAAANLLAQQRPHLLRATFTREDDGLDIEVWTKNVTRLDVSVDERPARSDDISARAHVVHLEPPREVPAAGESIVDLRAYEGSVLVAARRELVRW